MPGPTAVSPLDTALWWWRVLARLHTSLSIPARTHNRAPDVIREAIALDWTCSTTSATRTVGRLDGRPYTRTLNGRRLRPSLITAQSGWPARRVAGNLSAGQATVRRVFCPPPFPTARDPLSTRCVCVYRNGRKSPRRRRSTRNSWVAADNDTPTRDPS